MDKAHLSYLLDFHRTNPDPRDSRLNHNTLLSELLTNFVLEKYTPFATFKDNDSHNTTTYHYQIKHYIITIADNDQITTITIVDARFDQVIYSH